jgi:6-pyruvoyltetrahydropterin/6-carboxytetrahydropterin synthase
MYRLAIEHDFIARHYLIGGDFGEENFEHSHHYRVEVLVAGTELDEHGYLIDLVELDRVLGSVVGEFRERLLNELEPFRGLNPSLEHFARILWERLREVLPFSGRMTVKLWENERDWASYGNIP